jgi:hypothetical protein
VIFSSEGTTKSFEEKGQMSRMADIDEMMYSCGLETLHPGGIGKTDEGIYEAQICR